MSEDKKMKIEFAPGAFDNFDGTQEELDELMVEIQKMFEGKTPEELEEMSRPLTEDEFEDLPDEAKENLARFLTDEAPKRNLQ